MNGDQAEHRQMNVKGDQAWTGTVGRGMEMGHRTGRSGETWNQGQGQGLVPVLKKKK